MIPATVTSHPASAMSFRFVPHGIAALGIALILACSGTTDPRPGGPTPVLDALPRPLSAGEQKIIAANNDFSFALVRRLGAAEADSNVFVSPLSASMALGMAMNGASGTTFDEMRATLGFGAATESEIDSGYMSLIALLRGLDPAVDFRIANSIWAREGFPVTPSFLDAGRNWFDAQVATLDFASPAALSVAALLASLQTSTWSMWTSQFRDADVELYLPRLELSWERMLIPDLQALGMRAAFQDGVANFSRMSPLGDRLFISTVKQKT